MSRIATNDISHYREEYLKWIRCALIGPGEMIVHESDEFSLIGIQPIERYHSAILFPIVPGESGIDPASEESDDEIDDSRLDENSTSNSQAEPAIKYRRYVPPSSVGFSFFVTGHDICLQVRPWGVRYEKSELKRDEVGKYLPSNWARIPLGDRDVETLNLKSPETRQATEERKAVYNNKGEIHILWRPHADGWITTVSFCNKQEINESSIKEFSEARNMGSIFETELSCVIDSGEIGIYPRVDRNLLSEEEQELELQYCDKRIYAIGHGAAVDWILTNGHITEIRSNFFPAVEVPQVTADVVKKGTRILEIGLLAEYLVSNTEITKMLEEFVTDYATWVTEQKETTEKVDADERKAAQRITARMATAVMRMKRGIGVLKSDSLAAQAFGLANLAMLNQMEQYDKCLGKGTRTYRWRPFQLAFLLLAIESVVNEDSDHRDLVDLIWFPTGGGKTEAYLGLIAFLVTWRRLKFPSSSGGTSVLMRYTLRLLTAQQFERATRLICALELIRRKSSTPLGKEPISVGMWVGEASSPNNFYKAAEIVKKAANGTDEPPRSLILGFCPWCHSPFKASVNFIATEHSFHFRCDNQNCEFGAHGKGYIPCNVVDEALFEHPPTLLIATVDKFARLAWDERTSDFFGSEENRPPELIIQDELHLIAGALGSIAGLYEAALDTVLIQKGVRPKYIASTATIKMADQQVRCLYGRDLAIFPPPGISCDDSYFARTVPTSDRPGRLYVGYLAPIKNKQECMAPLAAALLAAPEIVFPKGHTDSDMLLEAWWTQVVYHGSLKGVGNSHNSFIIDVPDIIDASKWSQNREISKKTKTRKKKQDRLAFDRNLHS